MALTGDRKECCSATFTLDLGLRGAPMTFSPPRQLNSAGYTVPTSFADKVFNKITTGVRKEQQEPGS
jgi:hypothetical protein